VYPDYQPHIKLNKIWKTLQQQKWNLTKKIKIKSNSSTTTRTRDQDIDGRRICWHIEREESLMVENIIYLFLEKKLLLRNL